jgi:type IV secretory pathway VirB2 component (pilin)
MKKHGVLFVLTMFCVFTFAGFAEANTTANLPWDSSLKALSDSLTGPVAFSLGLMMIVCGFCAIAFVGSEIGGWVRWVAMAAILAGMLGAAPTVLGLFGLSAVMIM